MTDQTPRIYSVDASSLIDLPKLYPPNIFVSLWAKLDGLVQAGRFLVSIYVAEEVNRGPTDTWLRERSHIIRPFDSDINECMLVLMEEIEEFADPGRTRNVADPFVVALAMAENKLRHGGEFCGSVAVVSGERPRKQETAPYRIPDACQHYGIDCFNLLAFMRNEGWQF